MKIYLKIILCFIISTLVVLGYTNYRINNIEHYIITQSEPDIIKKINILKRIALCESSGKIHAKSKSEDHGLFQINKIHIEKAQELGLDIKKPLDNYLFALYLYELYGTKPWNNSRKCWNK